MQPRARRLRRFALLALALAGAVLVVRRLADQAALPFQSPGVGVVDVRGVIADSDDVVETLKRFRESDSIAAVVMRVESPGGAVGPAQEIYRAVRKLRESKPVVASLGNLAASGGYYIASACHPIVANPGTLTGSIGVIMSVRNVAELVEWAGIHETVIKSVPYKDIANPMRALTPEEQGILQRMVDDVHGQFVSAVAVGRGMPEATVREVADGRLYSGAQALSVGLVDELGGYEDAVAIAARAAGVQGEPRAIRVRPGRRMWWADWIGGAVGLKPSEWMAPPLPDGLQFLYLGAGAEAR